MVNKTASFRVGHVRVYLRGRVWYLSYFEQGVRRQPRVGPDRAYARQMAAEINGQLEASLPSALGFQPITIGELRQQWLDHHEHVRRSSVPTVRRYRAATQHLIEFLSAPKSPGRVADFRSQHAEAFVRYLRDKQVAPNGHAKARKRNLHESGIKFILETCSSLFNFAARRRHLPPYADNPFRVIEVHRMPIEDARPVVPFTRDQECRFLEACDDWQFPVFLTLLCTGLRPGELVHLLLPDDLDLERGWLNVRNKPLLGWQVKTRTQRDIPLIPVLRQALEDLVGDRQTGPVFLQRRCRADGHEPPLSRHMRRDLERELATRLAREQGTGASIARATRLRIAQTVWRDQGVLKVDWLRKEFMQINSRIGMAEFTAPKTLRHSFATILQDANVDPLIRNELMGHSPSQIDRGHSGLGMTAIYTHTRPDTKRSQLEAAFAGRIGSPYIRGVGAHNCGVPGTPTAPEA